MNFGATRAEIIYQTAKFIINRLLPHQYVAVGKAAIPKQEMFVLWAYHDSTKNIWEDANLTNRRLSFVAKSELYENRLFSTIMQMAHQIRFTRDRANIREFRSGIERAVRENTGIVVYPEGTRNESDVVGGAGRLMQFVAGDLIELSSTYKCRIQFVVAGRQVKMVNGKREDVKVLCVSAAYAESGRLFLADNNVQEEINRLFAANKKKEGLEVLVNGYFMPMIARLSGKPYNPMFSTFAEAYKEQASLQR